MSILPHHFVSSALVQSTFTWDNLILIIRHSRVLIDLIIRHEKNPYRSYGRKKVRYIIEIFNARLH